MSKKTRKRLPVQEKAAILRLHLLEHTPISDLCDRYGIHPTMFYRWQKELFENAAAALEPRARRAGDDKDRIEGSLPWNRSSNARTKSSPNSWRNMSN